MSKQRFEDYAEIADYVLGQLLPYQGVNEFIQNINECRKEVFRQGSPNSVFPYFAGNGIHGDLNVTTGTVTLDVTTPMQYENINIAAGATLQITHGDAYGRALIGCRGDCTIAGDIVVNALGSDGGAGSTNNNVPPSRGAPILFSTFGATGGGGGSGGAASLASTLDGGHSGDPRCFVSSAGNGGPGVESGVSPGSPGVAGLQSTLLGHYMPHLITPGTGGGGGSASSTSTNGGAGGKGGGALIIEVGGSLTFTGSITANGVNGAAGHDAARAGGGGGGGGAGSIAIVARNVVTDTGTITTNGGTGGVGGSGSSSGGSGGNGGLGLGVIIELDPDA